MERMREAVLKAASTLHYDAATLPGKQLGVPLLPEPFTKQHRLKSRLDGGWEIDGETKRDLIEVTPEEKQGHIVREQTLAEAQGRSSRNAYRHVPLTGCHQSMLPCYRSSAAFGHIEDFELDEYGLRDTSAKLNCLQANWETQRMVLSPAF